MTKLQRRGLGAKALVHLAEMGPTASSDLKAFMSEGENTRNVSVTMGRLKEMGFIKTKVWLTPEGLAEVERLGLNPRDVCAS